MVEKSECIQGYMRREVRREESLGKEGRGRKAEGSGNEVRQGGWEGCSRGKHFTIYTIMNHKSMRFIFFTIFFLLFTPIN